jgi:hypothetical protein
MRTTAFAVLVSVACLCTAAGQTTLPDDARVEAATRSSQTPTEHVAFDDTRAFTVYPRGTMSPVDLPDGSRATVVRTFISLGDGPYDGYRIMDRFVRYYPSGARDTSEPMYEWSTGTGSSGLGEDYFVYVDYLIQGYSSGYRVFFCMNYLLESYSVGITWTGSSRSFKSYDFQARRLVTLAAPDYTARWYIPQYSRLEIAQEYGLPLWAVSEPVDSVVLLLRRQQYTPEQRGAADQHYYRRILQIFRLNGDTLSAGLLLDSIPAHTTSISDRIVPGYTDDVYILHCAERSDTILADRFLRDGRQLATVSTGIVPGIEPAVRSEYFHDDGRATLDTMSQFRVASYEVRRISGERFALTFTRQTGSMKPRSYTAIFDKDFLPLEPPQPTDRVPIAGMGDQRRFARDIDPPSVTDDAEGIAPTARIGSAPDAGIRTQGGQETSAGTFDVWPNPCRTVTYLRVGRMPSRDGQVSIGIYDALGRCQRTVAPGQIAESSGAVRIDVADLPSGIYHVLLSGGGTVSRGTLVVLR